MLCGCQNLSETDSFCFMAHFKKWRVLWIIKGYVDIMNSASLKSLNAHDV